VQLTFASQGYDRVRALIDGTIKPDGVELAHEEVFPATMFERAIGSDEFDLIEMGFSFYLGTLNQEKPPFVALPAFLSRSFRHSATYINADSGITKPSDLAGKRVGELFCYGHDAGVWGKGILSDEYGVRADSYSYFIGGVDRPAAPWHWLPFTQDVPGVSIEHIGPKRTLNDMLVRGEIDALVSAIVPPALLQGNPKVKRLFDDHEALERKYFAKKGIFPMMHLVVVRRELAEEYPWLVRSFYDALCAAKDVVTDAYKGKEGHMHRLFMIPWLTNLVEANRALMGDDYWPYGIKKNRAAIDAFLRFHYEQGLSKRRYEPEEIFAPELRDS
jgi:ABC-type nitrate/sulfonate/bicarbonate transport system substrate-binding protein